MNNNNNYYCYLIKSDDNTYIGITNNLNKRIASHNNKSGAKSTRKYNNWTYHKVIGIFNKPEALRFEWYWKHYLNKNNKWSRTKSGIENKIKRLNELLLLEEWNNKTIIY